MNKNEFKAEITFSDRESAEKLLNQYNRLGIISERIFNNFILKMILFVLSIIIFIKNSILEIKFLRLANVL